jgi:signal transduction histidine kinase
LAGLRERAEQLGGALRTSRQKNGGFELVLTSPLKKAGDDQGNAC